VAHRHIGDVLPQTFVLYDFHLSAARLNIDDPRFVWDTRFGGDLDVVDYVSGRLSLLIDTGSNYTVAPVETLEAIGCSPAASQDHVRITTADGVLIAPRVRIQALTVFEQRIDLSGVIAHDLPFAGPIDGLLGIDALFALRARIDIPAGQIEVT